ncbi:MAG: hypothetical protein K6T16_00660 [Candidatus Pacearchaeota archaeon]|nr:hypothetical protein [Candidatus Pacearchaeota archaeon]
MAKESKKKRKKLGRGRGKAKTEITKQKRHSPIITILGVAAILCFVFLAVLLLWSINLPIIEKPLPEKEEKIEFMIKPPLLNATRAVAYLPAVDKNGEGVITLLVVEAVPGSGRTLVDIDNLLFWADTQHSIRIAKNVAENISGIDTGKYDLVYNIYANASVIGGESAGAALAIATIAVLQNKSLREDVMITGTVNHDGTIGPVQAILPKAKAARKINASVFLVPLLQGQEIVYEMRQHCEKFGPTEFCTTEQIPVKVNITKEAGVRVVEVGAVEDALEYFFEE